jgi:hypothetical protein
LLGVARFDIVGVRMSCWLDTNDVDADADATGTVGLIVSVAVAVTVTLELAIDGTN